MKKKITIALMAVVAAGALIAYGGREGAPEHYTAKDNLELFHALHQHNTAYEPMWTPSNLEASAVSAVAEFNSRSDEDWLTERQLKLIADRAEWNPEAALDLRSRFIESQREAAKATLAAYVLMQTQEGISWRKDYAARGDLSNLYNDFQARFGVQ